jgi:hypothetical protein
MATKQPQQKLLPPAISVRSAAEAEPLQCRLSQEGETPFSRVPVDGSETAQ